MEVCAKPLRGSLATACDATTDLSFLPRFGIRWQPFASILDIGRYDAVVILEAPNEKTALKTLMKAGDHQNIETLLAIPRAEAVKLLD